MSTLRHRNAAEVALVLAGVLALALLALASADRIGATGLDIVSSDSLYLPLLFDGSILSFRLSSASNLFPETIYYAVARAAGQDEVDALLTAGILQCSVTTLLLARYCGTLAALAYNALYYLFGFPFCYSISFHQGVIVMTLLYLACPGRGARRGMSLLFTLADPLFALIAALRLAVRACFEREIDAIESWLVVAGYAGAFFLAESNVDLLKFAPVPAAALLAGWIATLPRAAAIIGSLTARVPVVRAAGAWRGPASREHRVCSALLLVASLIALAAGQPARYVLPVLVSSIVFYAWRADSGDSSRDRRRFAAAILGFTSFALLYAMVLPALAAPSRETQSRFACLTDRLRSLHVDAVATDYWTLKPLYVAGARDAGLHLLQLDFRDGTPDTWVNDYRFFRGRSHVVVRNLSVCNTLDRRDRSWPGHCAEDWYSTLGVRSRTPACVAFEIIETERPVDFSTWESAFASKATAFAYNFQRNARKLTSGP